MPQETDLKNLPLQEAMLPGSSVKVVESEEGKPKILEVCLIKSGWSMNGYFYPDSVVEQIAEAIKERNKLYLDHQDYWESSPSRSAKDWAATATESWYKEGKAFAQVEMTSNPATHWLYDEAVKDPKSVGASIDAIVRAKPYEPPEDEKLDSDEMMNRRYVVEELKFLNSVDFVTYASAGGEVEKVLASFRGQNGTSALTEALTKVLEQFTQKNAPPVVTTSSKESEEIEETEEEEDKPKNQNTNRKESTMADPTKKEEPTLTIKSLESDHPELYTQLVEKVTKSAKEEFEAASTTAETINTLESEVKSLKDEKKTLEEERDQLKTKVDTFEAKEAAVAKRDKVNGFIKEAELADEFVSEVFVKDLMKLEKDEDIQERIQDRKNLVEGQTETIEGNGPRKTKESETATEQPDDDALVKGIKG